MFSIIPILPTETGVWIRCQTISNKEQKVRGFMLMLHTLKIPWQLGTQHPNRQAPMQKNSKLEKISTPKKNIYSMYDCDIQTF